MNSKKRKKKKTDRAFFRYSVCCIIASAVMFVFAFGHYKIVNSAECKSYDAVISDVKFFSDNNNAWATFDASGKQSYFVFENRRQGKIDFEKLQQLSKDEANVSITYTDYKDWLRLLDFSDRQRVAEIRSDEEVVFSAEIHNDDMRIMRIMWSVIASVLLACGVFYFVLYKKLGR